MYNIELSPSPAFNLNPASKIPQNDWSFNPSTPLQVVSFIGQPNPPQVTIDVQIKDYILALGTSEFTEFNVHVFVRNPTINGQLTEWLTLSGFIAVADPNAYVLTRSNLEVTSVLDFNVINVPEGNSTTVVEYYVFGVRADSTYQVIDVIKYYVNLKRLNTGQLHLEPDTPVVFSYTVGGVIPPTQTRQLYCVGDFTIVAGKHIALSGDNINLISDLNGVKTYSGSGSQPIVFTLENSVDFEQNIYPYYATTALFNSAAGGVLELPVRVYIYETGTNLVRPETLYFRAIKGVQEAAPQPIAIRGVGNWTVTKPYFLGLNVDAGNGSDNVNVVPIHSGNLTPGVYTGKIQVEFNEVVYVVNVVHTVVDGLYTGFSPAALNFTKDRNAISEIFGLDTQKTTFLTEIQSFNYNSLEAQDFSSRFTKGIFNGKTDFWLGNLVHKTMPVLKSLSDIGLNSFSFPNLGIQGIMPFKVFNYYKPSLTHFLMKFVNRATGAQAGESREFFNVQFLKGRKPSRLIATAGIIDFKTSPIRVTKNSFTLVPIFKTGNTSKLKVYRNGTSFATLYPTSNTHVLFGVQLGFAPFTPGDVIDVAIEHALSEETIQMVQRYIMFDEGKLSYHIVWENEHGVPEVLEFTGDYQFKSDHKSVTNLSFKNFLEYTEKMDSTRKLSFSANTGWILKANQERIDSLVDANSAWIVFTDNRPSIQLVPGDAKLTNIDSEARTYQYTVDFTINPRHELENNSF